VEVVPFVDLAAAHTELQGEIRRAIDGVLARGDFILGEDVARFEEEFAAWVGVRHAVGVASGLDALKLALAALDIGSGDEVLVPASTFIATALAVTAVGAVPVPFDVSDDSGQFDAAAAAAVVTPRTKAVIPVHLYGHPVDMDAVAAFAATHGLLVIEDAAQAHGARWKGRACGSFGRAGCFSFYPAKNLGACGDGGIITTDDAALADRLRCLRNYGQKAKNEHVVAGTNSRLDTLQAAILRVKLRHLDAWNALRAAHAAHYASLLGEAGLVLPQTHGQATHVFHLYVVRSAARDALAAHLDARGIRTGLHYPRPFPLQPAYRDLGFATGSFPVAETQAREVLSLPMFPQLTIAQIERVAGAVLSFFRR
jgi:dTDP-4-amino-4,6-dideoxygalactose transaminase